MRVLFAIFLSALVAHAQGVRIKDLPLATNFPTSGRIAVDDATNGLRSLSPSLLATQIAPIIDTNLSVSAWNIANSNAIAARVVSSGGTGVSLSLLGTTYITGALITNTTFDASGLVNFAKTTMWGFVPYINGTGFVQPSTVTYTELPYLHGVTSPIQTQLNANATADIAASNALVTAIGGTNSSLGTLITNNTASIASIAGGSTVTTNRLIEWTSAQAWTSFVGTADSYGVPITAAVVWPDTATGTFTTVSTDSTWHSIKTFTVTHSSSGKTVSQSAILRDSTTGAVTNKPALTVN